MVHDTDTFGSLVQEILTRHGLSPRDAGRKSGLHHATIYDMRKGTRVSEATIERFCKGLDEDPHPMLVAAGYTQPRPTDPIEATGDALRSTTNLTEEQIEEALGNLRDFLQKVNREEQGN
jgi:transcriptional regulator with XRE-family HTH domain